MHRIAIALIAIASALVVSTARADLVCSDALATASPQYRWDELPSASSALYVDLRTCACGVPFWESGGPTCGPCSDACLTSNEFGDWICGTEWAVGADWTSTQADACNACISESCGPQLLACYLDN